MRPAFIQWMIPSIASSECLLLSTSYPVRERTRQHPAQIMRAVARTTSVEGSGMALTAANRPSRSPLMPSEK